MHRKITLDADNLQQIILKNLCSLKITSFFFLILQSICIKINADLTKNVLHSQVEKIPPIGIVNKVIK